MQTIRDLTTSAGRSEPRVWVERLMILASPGKDAEVIRDVALSKGVNFILAQEPALGTPRREVSGHSAGKTTFCRLLRYILGEQTFGTKINTQLISEAFPLGYVAAELHVLGRRWAVRRPFGGGRLSSILESASIEDLLRDGGTSVSREDYVKRLGFDDVLVPLPVRRVPRESVEITWHHLLAWCTRDQEARYQSIHDWRSPRSESGSPEFTFRKLSPLFAMRAALGVLPPNELGLENELAALDAQLDKVGVQTETPVYVPAPITPIGSGEAVPKPPVRSGAVIAQQPAAGARVEQSTLVKLTVSQ